MDERHRRLLGESGSDDRDARGEHEYRKPGRRKTPEPADALEREPGHYAAGADGTQDVPAAEEHELKEGPSTPERRRKG
jgi:hypothetical protein